MTMISCNEQTSNMEENSRPSFNIFESNFKEEFALYDLKYDSDIIFIYSFKRAYDTSFFLLVKRQLNFLNGKLLYYPPDYYKSFGEWKNSKAFLYKGINFIIEGNKWKLFSNKIDSLFKLEKKEGNDYVSEALHPAVQKVFFKGAFFSNEKIESFPFDSLYSEVNSKLFRELFSNYPTYEHQ